MRFFWVLALLATAVSMYGQGQGWDYGFDRYHQALESYTRRLSLGRVTMSPGGGAMLPGKEPMSLGKEADVSNVSRLITLANLDTALVRYPEIKKQTLALLREIEVCESSLEKNRQAVLAIEEKIKEMPGGSAFNFGTPDRATRDKLSDLEKEKIDLEMENHKLRLNLRTSLSERLAELDRQRNTPEGQQLRLPGTSAYLALLNSVADRKPGMSSRPSNPALPPGVVLPGADAGLPPGAKVGPGVSELNLSAYRGALAYSSYTTVNGGSRGRTDPAIPINLAVSDPSLAKAPRVRQLTISILQKVNEIVRAQRRSEEEIRSLSRRYNASSAPLIGASPDDHKDLMPQLQRAMQEEMKENIRISQNLQNFITAATAGIKEYMGQLSTVEDSPEGRQFRLPATSAFMAKLDPSIVGSVSKAPPSAGPPILKYMEVSTTTPEGFFGYETKPDVNTEQNGNQPPGSEKKDAQGNTIYIADRTKNVFVRGYVQPVTFGDIIQIKVGFLEAKVMNGVRVREYVYVK